MTTDSMYETPVLNMPDAAAVAIYLQTHPEFFNDHPELLRDLEIPHATGQAISLFERQVAALREENEKLKTRFDALVALAKDNEGVIRRIHQLVLALMETAGPQAIFALLETRLAQDFNADRIVALVFAAPGYVDGQELPQFVGNTSARRAPFAPLLDKRETVCGRLTQAQQRALFTSDGFAGSAVLIPLAGAGWQGLLAIASEESSRFDANMGTEFLAYLGDVVSLVLAPWIART